MNESERAAVKERPRQVGRASATATLQTLDSRWSKSQDDPGRDTRRPDLFVAKHAKAIPPIEVASQPGVPAEALNAAFLQTGSKQCVDHEGPQFTRRFSRDKVGGRVVRWNTSWMRA